MSKLKVEIHENINDNILRVYHNGKLITERSDKIEPEDVSFYRDFYWVFELIKEVYELGVEDGRGYVQGDLFPSE